ncbi:hypothetical protein AgCh_000496 [Apium graveolens]
MSENPRSYVRGEVDYIDYVSSDERSLIEITKNMLKEIGCIGGYAQLWKDLLNPTWHVNAFYKKIVNDLKCDVSKHAVYRAKRRALMKISGTHEEQYTQVWKRIIGLDGCHLKGPYRGHLLAAVGVDANDGMYPIAWAIVEAKNTDAWNWFLQYFCQDIQIVNDRLLFQIGRSLRSENQSLIEDKEAPQNPPPPPPATSQISSNMSRYESIKVPILKIHEYPIWKVRMAMCLEATYPEYLSRIYDGPHKPMNVAVAVAGETKKMEYDLEDSNLNFLLALPEKWDYKVTSINDNFELDETPLDEIYGILKTHELEMEKRGKRKGSKSRPVALKVEEKPKEKARRKGSSSSNSDKRNDRRNTDRKESKLEKYDKSKERCYNCDGIGHFVAECRKPKAEKKQVLISKKKNWDDSSDSDDRDNYALMVNAEIEADNVELKIPQTTLAFDTDDIHELRLFRKSLHVRYRDQTLEDNRIKNENSELKKRNDHLEIELFMLEIQKERDNVIYVKEKLFEKHAYLEKELAKKREVNNFRLTQEILENGCSGSGLGYAKRSNSDKKIRKETEKTKPVNIDNKVKLNKVQLKPIKFNSSVDANKSVNEAGSTSAPRLNLNTDKSEQVHTRSVNIGLMTQKQLNKKLKELHMKNKEKKPRKKGMARKNKEINIVHPKSEFRNRTGNKRNSLVLDSECSGHMTGYKSMLSEFEEKAGPSISYGDGNLGKILGYGKIKIGNVIIKNVALVVGLKHNLISVSQICYEYVVYLMIT